MNKIVKFNKLGKKEKKHLKEMGMTTLWQFKANRDKQLTMLADSIKSKGEFHPGIMEPCWECKMIARQLGLETCESQQAVINQALAAAKV